MHEATLKEFLGGTPDEFLVEIRMNCGGILERTTEKIQKERRRKSKTIPSGGNTRYKLEEELLKQLQENFLELLRRNQRYSSERILGGILKEFLEEL